MRETDGSTKTRVRTVTVEMVLFELEAGTRLHWSHRFVSSFTRCVPETTFSIEKAIRVGIMGEQGKEECHTLEAPEVNPHALDSGILSEALFL